MEAVIALQLCNDQSLSHDVCRLSLSGSQQRPATRGPIDQSSPCSPDSSITAMMAATGPLIISAGPDMSGKYYFVII